MMNSARIEDGGLRMPVAAVCDRRKTNLKFVAVEVTRLHCFSVSRMSLLTSAATNKKSFNILPPD